MRVLHATTCNSSQDPAYNGRTQQLRVRRERVTEVRRWLNNYQKLKGVIEAICELNHELLRPEPHRRRRRTA